MSQRSTTKRRVNRTKRAKLNSHGFKVYKNFRVYIGKATEGGWSRGGKPAPREKLVDMVRQMWNNDPSIKAMRKHINELVITYAKTGNLAGMWISENKKVRVIDDGRQSIDEYASTFVHEIIGHTFYDFARKWRRDELIKFNLLANASPPITTYVKQYEDEWKKINDDQDEIVAFQKRWEHLSAFSEDEEQNRKYNEDHEQLKQLLVENGHHTMTRYANEQHSAITEIVYGIGGHKVLLSNSDVQRLVDAWKELHY